MTEDYTARRMVARHLRPAYTLATPRHGDRTSTGTAGAGATVGPAPPDPGAVAAMFWFDKIVHTFPELKPHLQEVGLDAASSAALWHSITTGYNSLDSAIRWFRRNTPPPLTRRPRRGTVGLSRGGDRGRG